MKSITIPASVDTILESAFENCSALEFATFLGATKNVEKNIFAKCDNLHELSICNPAFKIKPNFFGEDIPAGLSSAIDNLYLQMSDGAIKQYVLNPSTWNSLPADKRVEIFLAKQGKTLIPAYEQCINAEEAEFIGQKICSMLTGKVSTKECAAAGYFLELFFNLIPKTLAKTIYSNLCGQRNAAKALQLVHSNAELVRLLEQ